MKRILIVIAAALLCAASSRAQYVVYDPALHTQTIIDEAQNIAKYVMMIDNQVQQINTMTSQLQQLHQYNQAFGNPSQILNLAGFTGLISDLQDTGIGQAVGHLRRIAGRRRLGRDFRVGQQPDRHRCHGGRKSGP